MNPIYLDYAATTPIDPAAARAMGAWLDGEARFGNPSSVQHEFGRGAAAAVEQARAQVASLIGADPNTPVFTAGATESNNLAILGAARFGYRRGRGDHVITVATEHQAVLEPCAQLEREGLRVTRLPVDRSGRLDLADLERVLDERTLLVSVMHANNEIGTVQDVASVIRLAHRHGALVHVDAAQSVGKLPVDCRGWDVDLLSVSAHKLYGPQGVGALYLRRQPRLRLEPLSFGGGQERGVRSGTVPVHQVVGFGAACAVAEQRLDQDRRHLAGLRERLWRRLEPLGGVFVNGTESGAPHVLNVSFAGVHGEALDAEIRGRLAVSAGSACSAANGHPSHVLRALGLPDALAHSSVRFSLGRPTTEAEIDEAATVITEAVKRLRAISPLWVRHRAGDRLESLYSQGTPLENRGRSA